MALPDFHPSPPFVCVAVGCASGVVSLPMPSSKMSRPMSIPRHMNISTANSAGQKRPPWVRRYLWVMCVLIHLLAGG